MKTYISLFSSAGIGCYGFKQQGFECIATNEIEERRIAIQRYNKKCLYDTGYISGDIINPETKEMIFKEIDRFRKNHFIKDVDVLIATPPCQGMSVANHKKNNELIRNSLVIESIKCINEIKPKFFVFENVKAFLNSMCIDMNNKYKTISEAIKDNLGEYNYLSKVVNFKNYGSNSSRTRTLIIGARKDIKDVNLFNIFPKEKNGKILRELFSNLEPLFNMGDISNSDIYHAFRPYKENMVAWIEKIKEGESAFDNKDKDRIPHQIINNKIVLNQNKNGNKYARWYMDRVGPCIHTRNDILSSQNTIHPIENRVFSIRELMLMMNIPNDFCWSQLNIEYLNNLSLLDKKKFLKKEGINIRKSIGEAVPTNIFSSIASNISNYLYDY